MTISNISSKHGPLFTISFASKERSEIHLFGCCFINNMNKNYSAIEVKRSWNFTTTHSIQWRFSMHQCHFKNNTSDYKHIIHAEVKVCKTINITFTLHINCTKFANNKGKGIIRMSGSAIVTNALIAHCDFISNTGFVMDFNDVDTVKFLGYNKFYNNTAIR